MQKQVYNLEFPDWCREMTIFGYKFIRVDDYPDKVTRLQHLVNIHSEYKITRTNGEHTVTALVDLAEKRESAVLEWSGSNASALSDILLLLSLFTGRDVFAANYEESEFGEVIILDDPRVYQWGGVLRASIPYKEHPIDPEPYSYDIGLEEGLNQIYELMRTSEWQNKYQNGYFLFLARQAFHRQTLESAFTQCWTIWEHLFTIHNGNWLSDEEIRRLGSIHKVAYLLVEYALTGGIDEPSRKRIKDLAEIRNRLVHVGRFPDKGSVQANAELFIRLTEFIIVKTLGLSPSDLFNTTARLEAFLNGLTPHPKTTLPPNATRPAPSGR